MGSEHSKYGQATISDHLETFWQKYRKLGFGSFCWGRRGQKIPNLAPSKTKIIGFEMGISVVKCACS